MRDLQFFDWLSDLPQQTFFIFYLFSKIYMINPGISTRSQVTTRLIDRSLPAWQVHFPLQNVRH